ncbi:hypothetical protein [uncultured Azohydromonas sp.]|uniref:hypothetical protein n=1 Tax=uncultured Azohydromonas sp. TaxID=487342 RepID=UPI0026396901|nr:hypothetical protein [uncultured Azohydromonas sp.]
MNGIPTWMAGVAWPVSPRPAAAAAPATEARGPAAWFDDAVGDVDISADLAPAARGLSVEAHAGRVLELLVGGRGPA